MKRLKRFYAVVSFIIAVSFIAVAADASVSYTVRKGDTLQRISKKYNIKVSEIKEANNLKSAKLSIGTKLSIPGVEKSRGNKDVIRSSKKGSSKLYVSNKPETESDTAVHVVKKGDTLKSVAKKYGVSVADLRKTNKLKRGKLRPGQQIVIRSRSHGPNTYIVKRGDTLRKLARRFKISVGELKAINSMEGNSLKPGQTLYLAKNAPEPKPESKDEASNKLSGITGEKSTPAITTARLEEVKELSTSEDVLADLSMQERLILFAKKMLHLPYHFGGNGAVGLDCSAYVQKAFSFIGEHLPRSAREQFNMGEAVDKDDLETGDLVFFKTYAQFPSHVGIYIGNNLFIHASSLSRKITIDSLETPYYFRRFIGAKRIIPDDDSEVGVTEAPAVKVN